MFSGCAHERAVLPALAGQVRVDVTDVAYDHNSGTHYVVLEEKAGRRLLPITIGDEEARAIIFELRGIKPERPLTYELLLKVIEQTGNKVDRVVIGELQDQVYYAQVYLDRGRYTLDSRPSDAIAIAIGANAPIFVADNLLQAAAPGSSERLLNTSQALGVTVQELTPQLAQYFGVPTHSGVLIADVEAVAGKSGLQRGDIVTQVDGRPVAMPEEFARAAAAGTSKIALTITRAGSARVVILDAILAHAHP